MPLYKILSYIYLDSLSKCYKRVAIVNKKPEDIYFSKLIKTVPKKKRSKYEDIYCCDRPPHCVNIIKNPENLDEYLSIDDMDILLSYLMEDGYKIETKLTSVFMKNKLYKNSDLICIVSKS